MIRAYAQKLTPPFSGQVQIAESDTYRALTMDGKNWEIQYVNRIHIRVTTLTASDIKNRSHNPELFDKDVADPKLVTMFDYIGNAELPFPSEDHYEFWLLDELEKKPLALIYSCNKAEKMEKFPSRADWTALPDAVMSVKKTQDEISSNTPPVNYRVEQLVAERAGVNRKAQWFNRHHHVPEFFPAQLVREDWPEPKQSALYQRYIERQAPRLLMLSELTPAHRQRLEQCCEPHAVEVARFCGLYPDVYDKELIKALRVEARLRAASGTDGTARMRNNRDGVLYK